MIRFLCRIIRLRLVAWPLLALPFFYLTHLWHQGNLGAWKVEDFQNYTGTVAIYLLVAVLCLTPLRVLFPGSLVIAAVNRHRRAIGVSCFFYACWHVGIYFYFAPSYQKVFDDLTHFVFIQAGLAALGLLTILALTSNDLIVRLISYSVWKFLHRIAYLAAALIFFHRAFGPSNNLVNSTVILFAPLVLLEVLRILRQMFNGVWGAAKRWRHRPAFEGVRKFRVARKVVESKDITSFYFEPMDGRKLKPFKPGQYLTYELNLSGREVPLVRCYSLSDAPDPGHYRASIKRIPAPKDHPEFPAGLSSTYFHDQVKEGDILNVRAPAGDFFLEPGGHNPVVLIGGGVGLTPVLSMLKAMAARGSRREIWFFYGVRNDEEAALRGEMEEAMKRLPNGQLRHCHSQPGKLSIEGKDYHFAQRISVDLLKKALPHNRFDFYFCGPGPLMQSLAEGLEAWKVPARRIHFEEFGPSSVRRGAVKGAASSAHLVFKRSKKKLEWTGQDNSLLEFGEKQGLKLRFGCRAGNCGSCKVKLLKGEVVYPKPPAADPGGNYALACQALPAGDLEIDA